MANISDYAAVAASAASAIPGIGPIATTALQGLAGLFGAQGSDRRALKNQKALMAYQNNLAIENWKLQNEYNLPSAQMERLTSAGLNPHLVYGQGAQTLAADLTQPNASFDRSQYQENNGLAAASMIGQIQNLQQQNANLRAEQGEIEARTEREQQQANSIRLDNFRKQIEMPFWARHSYADISIKEAKAKIAETATAIAEFEKRIKNAAADNAFANETWKSSILYQQWQNLKEDQRNKVVQRSVMSADIALKKASSSYFKAMASLSSEQQKYYKELTAKIVKDAVNAGLEGDLKKIEKIISGYDALLVSHGIPTDATPLMKFVLGNLLLGVEDYLDIYTDTVTQ